MLAGENAFGRPFAVQQGSRIIQPLPQQRPDRVCRAVLRRAVACRARDALILHQARALQAGKVGRDAALCQSGDGGQLGGGQLELFKQQQQALAAGVAQQLAQLGALFEIQGHAAIVTFP